MVDLLGRRFMMSDPCLFWQSANAHRAFPLSIPPPVFTLPNFYSALFYSLIFSSLPHPRLILSPSSSLLLFLSVAGIIWSVCGFCGSGGIQCEALFLQCPRWQCSRGVLTAESPHNAQALRFFRLHRQNVRANSLLHCPGYLHLLE